jgi:hypothetical protein
MGLIAKNFQLRFLGFLKNWDVTVREKGRTAAAC